MYDWKTIKEKVKEYTDTLNIPAEYTDQMDEIADKFFETFEELTEKFKKYKRD